MTNPVTGTGTTNQIAYWTSSSAIGALDTATYPSLTELSYVKGVTSAIQTQLNAKEPTVTKGNLTETTSSVLTITGGTGAVIGSGTTIAVASAGAAQAGVVTTGTQTFAGNKTLTGALIGTSATFSSLSQNYIIKGGASGLLTSSGIIKEDGTKVEFLYNVSNSNQGLNLVNSGGSGYGNSINFYQSTTQTAQIRCESSVANTSEILFKTLVGGVLGTRLTIASTGAATFSSSITASSFIKSGGTSSQILMADGSVLTAGTNITISGGTISSTGGGSSLNGTGFVRMAGTTVSYITGTSSQFVKADGSLDGTGYITGLSFDGLSSKTGGTGTYQTSGDFRAPIFYDSNDTTYYGDFAGTSYLRQLSVGDVNAANDGGWNARLNLTGSSHARLDVKSNSDGIITTIYSHSGHGVGRVGTMSNHPLAFMVNGGVAGYAYANYLQGVDSVRAPIFYDSQDTAYFCDPNGRSRLSSIDYGNGSFYLAGGDWGWRHNTPHGWIQFGPANGGHAHIYTDRGNFYLNVHDLYLNGNFVPAYNYNRGGALYASIFYDSNDTGYYLDPNSLSNVLEIKTNRNWYDNSATSWGGGINITGNNPSIGWQPTGNSPWYMMHWSTYMNFYRRATNGSWNQDGIWDTSGNLYWNNGLIQSNASMRAPIFYDSNDTTYYMDYNSTTSGRLRGNLIFNDYGAGIVGTYDASRYQAVFSMGDAYKLPINGTSTGNLYGLAWSHPNAGGVASNLNDHGLLVINNGV
ncbi:MAG: hypothetical protein FJ167_07250, partial [Gammaproteobacteria bacterium]|nr:hypothetical protein [Gammaproteobacteria bacterium]